MTQGNSSNKGVISRATLFTFANFDVLFTEKGKRRRKAQKK